GAWSRRVKAASRGGDGGERRVQARFRNLHEIRHIGPHERGANALARVELPEHRAVKRKLGDIGVRYLGEAAGRGTIGLVVGNEDRLVGHRETGDLARHGKRAAFEPADDWNLRAAPGEEQLREARIVAGP